MCVDFLAYAYNTYMYTHKIIHVNTNIAAFITTYMYTGAGLQTSAVLLKNKVLGVVQRLFLDCWQPCQAMKTLQRLARESALVAR